MTLRKSYREDSRNFIESESVSVDEYEEKRQTIIINWQGNKNGLGIKHFRVEEYACLGETVSANPAHEKQIRRIGKGWSAFGGHSNTMNTNSPLSLKKAKLVYPATPNILLRNLIPYKII